MLTHLTLPTTRRVWATCSYQPGTRDVTVSITATTHIRRILGCWAGTLFIDHARYQLEQQLVHIAFTGGHPLKPVETTLSVNSALRKLASYCRYYLAKVTGHEENWPQVLPWILTYRRSAIIQQMVAEKTRPQEPSTSQEVETRFLKITTQFRFLRSTVVVLFLRMSREPYQITTKRILSRSLPSADPDTCYSRLFHVQGTYSKTDSHLNDPGPSSILTFKQPKCRRNQVYLPLQRLPLRHQKVHILVGLQAVVAPLKWLHRVCHGEIISKQ